MTFKGRASLPFMVLGGWCMPVSVYTAMGIKPNLNNILRIIQLTRPAWKSTINNEQDKKKGEGCWNKKHRGCLDENHHRGPGSLLTPWSEKRYNLSERHALQGREGSRAKRETAAKLQVRGERGEKGWEGNSGKALEFQQLARLERHRALLWCHKVQCLLRPRETHPRLPPPGPTTS